MARFLVLLLLLVGVYGAWLATFWPGVLGEDSVAVLLEVQNPEAFRSGKTVVWYYFVKLLYGTTARVEAPVIASLLICAALLARMLAWYWEHRLYKVFWFALFAIALAPHMIYFMGSLYPDGLFAVASAAMLFEVWLCVKRRTASTASLSVLALALPFAVFVRPNGLILLVPVALGAFWMEGRGRVWWVAITVCWCAIVSIGNQLHRTTTQETQFPLAAFETAGFLQKRAMNELWKLYPHMNDPWVLAAPKVSQPSIEALSRQHSLEKIQQYRDPVYWDMLVFHPEGPQVGGLSTEDKRIVVREFWTYNLWHNLPDFVASRVNVFLSAALAQGGFPSLSYASNVLPRVSSESTYRIFQLEEAEHWSHKIHAKSYRWRWVLWTPWLGFALLLWAAGRCIRCIDVPVLLIVFPMILQWGGVFFFSIAGEYRYLLPFFTLPLALLPAISSATKNAGLDSAHRVGNPLPPLDPHAIPPT
ncbi:hypothetical protein LJR129_004197 [Acidovorax sp. LjRoot129]|uniref:hypothetical protein n=1 Tax=Acidovorax sp. LjRoot129 TaxID=3342260 RepID=UPI003ECE2F03